MITLLEGHDKQGAQTRSDDCVPLMAMYSVSVQFDSGAQLQDVEEGAGSGLR